MRRSRALLLGLAFFAEAAWAQDVLESRMMSMELARDIAGQAVEACRDMGYQVSAVVIDRSGRSEERV